MSRLGDHPSVMTLTVTCIGYGKYHVTGGREDHWVCLSDPKIPMCDCAHHLWRDAICRHIKACQSLFHVKHRESA